MYFTSDNIVTVIGSSCLLVVNYRLFSPHG